MKRRIFMHYIRLPHNYNYTIIGYTFNSSVSRKGIMRQLIRIREGYPDEVDLVPRLLWGSFSKNAIVPM